MYSIRASLIEAGATLGVAEALQPHMGLTRELQGLKLTQKSHCINGTSLLSHGFEEWIFWATERMSFQKGIYYRFIGDSLRLRKQTELFSESESQEMCCHGDAHLEAFHRTNGRKWGEVERLAGQSICRSPPTSSLYKMSMYLSIQVAELGILTHSSTSS